MDDFDDNPTDESAEKKEYTPAQLAHFGRTGANSMKNRLAKATRNTEIIKDRASGMTLEQLSKKYELTPAAISIICKKALATGVSAPVVNAMREEKDQELQVMLDALRPNIEAGSVKAVEAGVRVIKQQSSLFGLDSNDALKAQAAARNSLARSATVTEIIALIDYVLSRLDLPLDQKIRTDALLMEGVKALGFEEFFGVSSSRDDEVFDVNVVDGEVISDEEDVF